ncbi:MAG: GNAT family N-acetyltransferase [Planctomycetes bacterium]|nr:GNAT family N-acetyltransferase [Planctomycetota bacterium]
MSEAFSFATSKDKKEIESLLSESTLPYQDISDHLNNFIVAKENGRLIGSIAIEHYKQIGLLRSLAVLGSYRNKGTGKALYERLISHAHLLGIKKIYLLTSSAEKFFAKLGFSNVQRNDIPEQIANTKEFKVYCPSTAVCMSKSIDTDAFYLSKDILQLQPDIKGAKMWGITLDNIQFTYFEVEPQTRFEKHNHESEQITMVLEGSLYFETEGKISEVKAGEVFAIPSNIPHAVFTRDKPAKAVDAWSPPNQRYIQNP